MKIGLVIPTYRGKMDILRSFEVLQSAAPLFHRRLVIDSYSRDGVLDLLRELGFETMEIPKHEFDHGGTRQLGVEILADCDIIVFLTQDALLTSPESIHRLVQAFDDPDIGIAYGRQLPRLDAGLIEAHARIFNYPEKGCVKSKSSIVDLGLRTPTVSNSFAAYRRCTLMKLGGFPKNTIFGEDTLVGAKAILAGINISYVGEATVYHSHRYSILEEFRRYFDNGVFYSRERWITDQFGRAEGSGKKYVLSEIKLVLKQAPWLFPKSILAIGAKYFGYKLGQVERFLPNRVKKHFSQNRGFWEKSPH